MFGWLILFNAEMSSQRYSRDRDLRTVSLIVKDKVTRNYP